MLIREYISVMSTPALLSYSGQCKSKQSTLLSLGRDAQQNGLAVMVGKLNETYCMWKDKKRHHYSDTSISWYDVLVTTVKETTGNVGLGHLAISWKTIIIPQQCHVLISSEQHSGWEVQPRGCRRWRLRVNSWKSCTKLLCRLFSIAYVSMFRHFVCSHRPHLIFWCLANESMVSHICGRINSTEKLFNLVYSESKIDPQNNVLICSDTYIIC